MYNDVVKELRTTLVAQVTTINLLLMTEVVSSIVVAEEDQSKDLTSLESKNLKNRELLHSVQFSRSGSAAKAV